MIERSKVENLRFFAGLAVAANQAPVVDVERETHKDEAEIACGFPVTSGGDRVD